MSLAELLHLQSLSTPDFGFGKRIKQIMEMLHMHKHGGLWLIEFFQVVSLPHRTPDGPVRSTNKTH